MTTNDRMRATLPGLAIALAAAFFGTALYINLAEQPARLALPDGALLTQWQLSYAMGVRLQGSLALVTGLTGFAAWWAVRDRRWLAGALLMLANWPWTLMVIAPVNAALMGSDAGGPATRALIEQWSLLHAARTGLGGAALLLFLWAGSRMPRMEPGLQH